MASSPPEIPASRTPAVSARGGVPRRLVMLILLSWRNLWRNPWRSMLTAGAMVVGVVLMIGYLALMEGMIRQMVDFATEIAIGHLQVHRAEYVDNQDLYALIPDDLLEQLERETPYRYAPRAYAAALGSAGNHSAGVMLKAVDPGRESKVTDLHQRIRQGAFALEGVRRVRPQGGTGESVPVYPVVVGHRLAKALQLELGGELVLISQAMDGSIGNGLFEVKGILAPIDPAFDRLGVVMSLEAFRYLMVMDGAGHELAVNTDDTTVLGGVKERIEATVRSWPGLAALVGRGGMADSGDGGGEVMVRTWYEINPPLNDMIVTSRTMIYMIAIIVFVIAAMGILNTMLMAVHERRQELGLLRALGLGRAAMMGMVLLEAFFLSIFAGIVGAGAGLALAWYLATHGFDYSRWLPEGMDFLGVMVDPVFYGYLMPEHVWISLGMMVVTTQIAALLPSWRTARLDPVRALYH